MQLVVSDSLQICLIWFNQLPVIRNAINLVQFVLSKGNIEYHLSLLVSVFWDISYLPELLHCLLMHINQRSFDNHLKYQFISYYF